MQTPVESDEEVAVVDEKVITMERAQLGGLIKADLDEPDRYYKDGGNKAQHQTPTLL